MLILIFDSYILILSEIEGIKSILQDYNPEKKMFEYICQFPVIQINIKNSKTRKLLCKRRAWSTDARESL